MSAPYIIPFNHQPVNTGVTASTYTAPSGKYARVLISNLILPVLNGAPLCSTYNLPSRTAPTTAAFITMQVSKAHRVSLSHGTGAQTVSLSASPVTVTSTVFDVQQSNPGTATYIFPNPSNLTIASVLGSAAITYNLSVDYCDITELWLKSGDVLSFTSGRVIYEEYNEIS